MRWFAVPLCLFLLAGCSRIAVTTKVASDGSFTRKIRYAVKKPGEGMTQSGPQTVEDAFRLPSGSNVTVNRHTDKDEIVAEVVETVPAGAAPLKDVVILSEKKAPNVESTVRVRKLANGDLEYVEHLHYTGAPDPNPMKIPDEVRALIKKNLPAKYQVTAIIDGVRDDLAINIIHAFFGPSQPIIWELLTNQDAAEKRLSSTLAPQLLSDLKSRMPDLTDDQALSIARAIVGDLKLTDLAKEKANAAQPSPDPNAKKSDNSELTPMTFSVSAPGKIVESNGITDLLTGEVYWSLYSPSVQVRDVDLRVVTRP